MELSQTFKKVLNFKYVEIVIKRCKYLTVKPANKGQDNLTLTEKTDH